MDSDSPHPELLSNSLLPAPPAVLAIVGAQLLVGFLAFPFLVWSDTSSDWSEAFVVGGLYGNIMGQLALIVAYQAWGREDWLRRGAKSVFLLVLGWAALAAGARSTGNSFEVSSMPELLANVMVGVFFCLAVPLWGARLVGGLRFGHVQPGPDAETTGWPKFQLRELLVGTVGAAIVFGIMQTTLGRQVLKPNWSISGSELGGLAMFSAVTSLPCALAAIPAAWTALGSHRLDRALAGLAVYMAAAVTLERFVFYAFVDQDPEGWLITIGLNTGVVAQVLLTSLLLRSCGYRLRMRGK